MNNRKIITCEVIEEYRKYLLEDEKSENTISAYLHTVNMLCRFIADRPLTKELLIEWKNRLCCDHMPSSVNRSIAAVNGLLKFNGWNDMQLKPLRVQHMMFAEKTSELTDHEFEQLLRTARKEGKERLYLILQTIGATGIRISELKFITTSAVAEGKAQINCKGKRRTVFIPDKLRRLLQKYIEKHRLRGCVFVTRNGKNVDRSNIWREMKQLADGTGVAKAKLYPHNLRHLFARTYYSMQKDLSRLADILGHSNVSTTRIYTRESGEVHARQLESLGLIFDFTT